MADRHGNGDAERGQRSGSCPDDGDDDDDDAFARTVEHCETFSHLCLTSGRSPESRGVQPSVQSSLDPHPCFGVIDPNLGANGRPMKENTPDRPNLE